MAGYGTFLEVNKFGSSAEPFWLKLHLSWEGGALNPRVKLHRALHGAKRPEERLVVPSRRARTAGTVRAKRRGGEVGLTGMSATATPSGAQVGEQHQVFKVTKISSEDRILQRTGDQTDSRGFRPGQGATGDVGAAGGSAEDGVSERFSSCHAGANFCEDLGG